MRLPRVSYHKPPFSERAGCVWIRLVYPVSGEKSIEGTAKKLPYKLTGVYGNSDLFFAFMFGEGSIRIMRTFCTGLIVLCCFVVFPCCGIVKTALPGFCH